MIPLADTSRRPRRFPIVTAAIILANGLVFLMELTGGDAFVSQWSVIPADIMTGRHLVTIVTAMFMHAGWMHIVGNMVFLWAFGPVIEDAMGPLRYFAFYLLSGLAASAAQIVAMSGSTVPNLGASGAIAGVMGAFLITYPRDEIRTLLLFGWFARITIMPAALLIGLWFVIQLFSQVGAVADVQTGGVAYMAHVGGFIFGATTARIFESGGRSLNGTPRVQRESEEGGAPDRVRTCGLRLRRPSLYPAELRARSTGSVSVTDLSRIASIFRGQEADALSRVCLPRFCHESRLTHRRVRRQTDASIPVTPSRRRGGRWTSGPDLYDPTTAARHGSVRPFRAIDIQPRAAGRESASQLRAMPIGILATTHH
jgi:membrane associated rhomboid family serine protease